MHSRFAYPIALLLLLGCAAASPPAQRTTSSPRSAPLSALVPAVDHHKHLMSDTAAALITPTFEATVRLPHALEQLLRSRERAWNDSAGLALLYTDSSLVYESRALEWVRGRDAVAGNVATRYARAYTMAPFQYSLRDSAGSVVGYLSREAGGVPAPFGYFHLSLELGRDGRWRIAAESPSFPGPQRVGRFDADQLIAELDAAGIRRAVVLSVAYWWARPGRLPDIAAQRRMVQSENDFTAREAAKHPDRLVAFCSVNPLNEYALEEIRRCARELGAGGLKMHFGNSDVDVHDSRHVQRLQQVFREADRLRLPIVAHLWTDPDYGREDASIFLEQIVPHAPNVVVQIAHFAGGGPGYTDPALEVFAEALERRDPRARNLYFDLTTVAEFQPDSVLETLARRIRQVGIERVLWGSDLALPNGNAPARVQWRNFVASVPLTPAELAAIAANVAPYLR